MNGLKEILWKQRRIIILSVALVAISLYMVPTDMLLSSHPAQARPEPGKYGGPVITAPPTSHPPEHRTPPGPPGHRT